MSTISKQWLQQKISDMEATRDEIPFGLDEDDSNMLAALRIALASLEAEAVGEVVLGEFDDCGCHPDARVACIAADGQADWENFKDGTRLYTAPPAPVSVPDDVSGPLAHAYKELTPTFMRNHIDVFERYGIYPDGSAGIQAMRIALDGMNRRAAMLQGAEPVTTANKLPAEAVYGYFAFNDHHGEEFFKKREDAIAFCKEAIEEYRQENAEEGCDPDEVRRTCWGIIMQEGTDFEVDNEGHIDYALTPELAGNSPVIPDGWVACSERMPEREIDVQVYCSDKKEQMVGYMERNERDGYFRFASLPNGGGVYCQPTHWMPLPAAPQQEA